MRKKPDYAKEATAASAVLTAMKIRLDELYGGPMGSGDRAAAVERLRRRCEIAASMVSTLG